MADTTAEVPATEAPADAVDASAVESLKRDRDDGEDAAPGEDSDAKKVKASDEQADAMAKAMAAVQALNSGAAAATPAVGDADAIITKEIDCPQTLVGKVIGKGGETIKDLQARSGAKIQVEQSMPPGQPRKIMITGVQSAVDAAVVLVTEVLATGEAERAARAAGTPLPNDNPGDILENIDCPKTLVGRIIGKGGETIKALQMRSGTRIQIDQNVQHGQPCKVQVTGSKAAVAVAVGMVKDLMVEGASGNSVMGASAGGPAWKNIDANAPGNIQQIVNCEKRLVGRIIGKGGETINYLQSTSGTRIQIDQNVPEGTPCKVSIAGPPPAVAVASKMVHDCMENGPPREIAMQQAASPYSRPQAGVMGAYGARPAPGGYGQQAFGAAAGGYGAAMGGYGQQQPGYGAPAPAAGGYGGGYGGAQAGGYGQQAYGAPARGGYGAPAPTPPAWSEHATDDGTKYWYNAQTGESTWTKPAGM